MRQQASRVQAKFRSLGPIFRAEVPKHGAQGHRTPEGTEESAPLDVGYEDWKANGWFNNETGQVYEGFPVGPDDVVLDVGCGEAPHSMFLAPTGARILLADILEDTISAAENRMVESGGQDVVGLVTDCDPIPLPDASVTRVMAIEVLEHVLDPKSFMSELVRVGRPGSLHLVSIPHRVGETLQRDFAAPEYFESPNHIRIFAEGELEALVESVGLEVLTSKAQGFYNTMWWLFFWVSAQPQVGPPFTPLMESWTKTWGLALQTPQGLALKKMLDETMPKSQVVLAMKPL